MKKQLNTKRRKKLILNLSYTVTNFLTLTTVFGDTPNLPEISLTDFPFSKREIICLDFDLERKVYTFIRTKYSNEECM